MIRITPTIILLTLSWIGSAQSNFGLRIPEDEHFIFALHMDYPKTLANPDNSKERGLQYNVEVGIRSAISNLIGTEVKIGYDAFPGLYGGYQAYTGSFGVRMVSGMYEEWNYYAGYKAAKVYRTGPRLGRAYRVNVGLEVVVTRRLWKNLDFGLRYTLDQANDQQIMGWEVESRHSVYATVVFKVFSL